MIFLSSSVSIYSSIVDTIYQRLAQLHSVATSKPHFRDCNESRLVVITEFPWGNAGNQLISFTHGLYMAQMADATFIVPHYMSAILHPFNLTLIRKLYCFKEEWEYEDSTTAHKAREIGLSYTHIAPPPPKYKKKAFLFPTASVVMEIESEQCFFLYRYLMLLEKSPHPMLSTIKVPTISQVIKDLSEHFIRVYCALWASPIPAVITAAAAVIDQKLNSSSGFTAVHKRSLEGGCNKVMSQVTAQADFSSDELPMSNEVWQRINKNFHPLCEMPAQFVLQTCALHYNKTSTDCGSSKGLFVAFDGRGDVSDFKAIHAVFSSDVDYSAGSASASTASRSVPAASIHDVSKIDKKFVDMFVAMMSEFFILNPRSTFSWEIYLIRLALGLQSVPVMTTKDVYVLHPDDYRKQNNTLWVNWVSSKDAVGRIKST